MARRRARRERDWARGPCRVAIDPRRSSCLRETSSCRRCSIGYMIVQFVLNVITNYNIIIIYEQNIIIIQTKFSILNEFLNPNLYIWNELFCNTTLIHIMHDLLQSYAVIYTFCLSCFSPTVRFCIYARVQCTLPENAVVVETVSAVEIWSV